MSPFSEAVAAAVNPYLVDNSTPTKNAQNSATTITLHPFTDSNNMQSTTFQPSPPSGSSTGGKRPTLNRELSREDMDLEVNTVQKDLDHLKEMLSGQITLDSSLISNLFNPDESLSSLFSGQDLNLGPFSPSSLNPTSSSSAALQSLEMEVPTTRDEAMSLMIAPSAATASHQSGIKSYDHQHTTNIEDHEPPLFEFEDIDNMDDPIDVVSTVPDVSTGGEKQKKGRNMKMNIIQQEPSDSYILNTPLISSGDDQDNPLLKSIGARKKK